MQSSLTCQFEHSGKVRSGLIGNFYFHCYQVRPHFLCAALMSSKRTKQHAVRRLSIYIYIYTQQQGCQFHNTKGFSPIFISSYMGMSKNENEARIYTGGRESARIFLRASSSHYTTIRMYGAVEKCGKQHMRGMQYQNKHMIKLSVRLQLEQP